MARSFNGSSDWISTNATWNPASFESFFFAGLFKANQSYGSGVHAIMMGAQYNSNSIAGLWIGQDTGRTFGNPNKAGYRQRIDSETDSIVSAHTIDDGAWHSVVGGRYNGNTVFIVVDDNTWETGGNGSNAPGGSMPIGVGALQTGASSASDYFNGEIANVFYCEGVSITQAQAEALSKALLYRFVRQGLHGVTIPTGGIWHFLGSRLDDSSGLGNTATVKSGTTVVDSPPIASPFFMGELDVGGGTGEAPSTFVGAPDPCVVPITYEL